MPRPTRTPLDLPARPNFAREDELIALGYTRIAGVDEAGRGPLAGPVVAAAVLLPRDFSSPSFHLLHDSKQLKSDVRARLFLEITSGVKFGIGVVDAATIDEINIRQASWRAMQWAVTDLSQRRQSTLCQEYTPDYVLIDGLPYGDGPWTYEALVKGDARSLSIAAAFVVAKETRDAMMRDFDREFPAYGFASHKGYGTRHHLRALSEFGPCAIHRLTFAPVRAVIR